MYYLITEVMPFNGKSMEELLLNIKYQDISFKHQKFSQFSSDCIQFLSLLLERNPKKRITSGKLLKNSWFLK